MRKIRETLLALSLMGAVASLVLSRPVLGQGPTPQQSPRTVALLRVHELKPSRMGVDRHNNLWAWDRSRGQTWWVNPAGEVRPGPTIANASAVDLDSEWGAVALSGTGDALLEVPDGGGKGRVIRLPNQAGHVCWVGPRLAAISPRLADHRVELWDLGGQFRALTFGTEQAITPRPGAQLARAVILHFDFERERLVTLEAFSGDLQVFARDGSLIYRTIVPVPEREKQKILSWLQQSDERARASGDSKISSVLYFADFALDSRGAVWVVGERSEARNTTTFVTVRDGETPRSVTVKNTTRAAPQATIWGEWLIQYSDASAPGVPCMEERETP